MPTIVRRAFPRGIVSSIEPTIIPEDSFFKGYNIESDLSGILKLRKGSKALFPSLGDGNIQAITYFLDRIYFVWNRFLFSYDFESDNAVRVSEEMITETLDEKVTMIKWARNGAPILYIFGGIDIFQTDGETLTRITPYEPQSGEEPNMLANEVGPQQGKFATLRASLSQRVAVAGIPTSPNTVYLSSPLDITYFPLSQILQLPDDGNVITGITNWYNSLLIFRTNDIWCFFGTDLTDSSASLVLQDNSIGCIAPNSITHVPNVGVCFLGPDNIYAIQGVSGVENQAKAVPIGDNVVNLLQESISEERPDEAVGIYFNREFILSFPYANNIERIFKFNLNHDAAWFINNGPPSNNYLIVDQTLYGTYPDKGYIYELDSDLLNDETQEMTLPNFSSPFNGLLFNEAVERQVYKRYDGIPFSITFRREDLQPGPARVKRIFLYVLSLGSKQNVSLGYFGDMFNSGLFGQTKSRSAIIDTTTEQNFNVTVFVDGNEIKIDEFKVHSKKLNHEMIARSEPIRIYEARIRPSLKAHHIQIKVDSENESELISLLGYGVDFQQKGRTRGIREGVTKNKDW